MNDTADYSRDGSPWLKNKDSRFYGILRAFPPLVLYPCLASTIYLPDITVPFTQVVNPPY